MLADFEKNILIPLITYCVEKAKANAQTSYVLCLYVVV
jgi:hypothetical protein